MDCVSIVISGSMVDIIALGFLILATCLFFLLIYPCGYHWMRQRCTLRRAAVAYRNLRGIRRGAQRRMDRRSEEFVRKVHDLGR